MTDEQAPGAETGAGVGILWEPYGFRDVYWCFNINEPAIMHMGAGPEPRMTCSACFWSCDDDQPQAWFLSAHRFLCHLLKPQPDTHPRDNDAEAARLGGLIAKNRRRMAED